MYKYYIAVLFAAFTTSIKADTTVPNKGIVRDSIGVENYKGKKLIIHQVVAKDTYYSIGRRYKVAPNEILTFNNNKFLQIGVIIKVPTSIPFENGNKAPKTDTAAPAKATPAVSAPALREHVVQRQENLNMLARKYGTTVEEIKRLNNLNTFRLDIGQVLKVPGSAEQNAGSPKTVANGTLDISVGKGYQKPADTAPAKAAAKAPPKEEFLSHVVAGNETMYSIASKYKLTVPQLLAKNKLTSSSLYVGQRLLITGEWPAKEAYEPGSEDADTIGSLKDPSLRYPSSRYGLNQLDEKGTAVWISDEDMDSSKMYVLHRTAPIGTVMKITYPMSNRSTFAKVVGKFTENESTKDVIIVMTKAVADALGALDKRFYCNLTYGVQEHEQ